METRQNTLLTVRLAVALVSLGGFVGRGTSNQLMRETGLMIGILILVVAVCLRGVVYELPKSASTPAGPLFGW